VEAKIYQFPTPVTAEPEPEKLSCSDCQYAAFSTFGIFCLQLREDLIDESWASECEFYTPFKARSES
jgi:hypothetical protein